MQTTNKANEGSGDSGAAPVRLDAGPMAFTMRNYGGYAVELLASSVVINAIALAFPIFSMVVYNKVIGNQVPETLWALALGALLLCMVEWVLRATRGYFVEHIGTRWDNVFDRRVLAASMRCPMEQLPDVGRLMQRYRDTTSSRDFLSSAYVLGLADIPFLPLYVLLLALIGSWVALIPVVLGAVLFVWVWGCQKVSFAYTKSSLESGGRKLELLAQSVLAAEVLRVQPGVGRLPERLDEASQEHTVLTARSRYWNSLCATGVGALIAVASIATIVLGVYLVEAQAMSMGALIASSTLVARAMSVIYSVASAVAKFDDFKQALTRLEEDLPGATTIDGSAPVTSKPGSAGLAAPAISLERACYRYRDDGRSVLTGIDLKVEPGERIALVGRAGSGKSTLLRLLSGLVLPTDGQLLVDFNQIGKANVHKLRASVALKPQDCQLIDGTVLLNVAETDDKANEQTVVQLLRDVGLASALQSGELALNTIVGDQGRFLSGGQRQMVAFARALYQMRPILILDEPTLGLDQMSQAAVIRSISNLPRNVTVIVATHSAELLQAMDRVVAIDAGRKVADGPRDSLLLMANQPPKSAPTPMEQSA